MFLLLLLCLIDSLNKTRPVRVYPIHEQVIAWVEITIHLEVQVPTFAIEQISKVGDRSKTLMSLFPPEAKKKERQIHSDWSRIASKSRSDSYLCLGTTFVIHWTVLPLRVHAIQRGKYARKSLLGVNLYLPLKICFCRKPKIFTLKAVANDIDKATHGLSCSTLS